MSDKKYVTPFQIAGIIAEREDNILFKKSYISEIIKMYLEECQKALLRGERVLFTGIGTIIPNVDVKEKYNLLKCNKEGGNPPFAYMKMTSNQHFIKKMNQTILNNIENEIYGLEKLPFNEEQMDYLKEKGFVPKDAKVPDDEEEE